MVATLPQPQWVNLAVMEYHYVDVIMGAIASQITSLTIVYSIVYSDADQRKHQSSASLAFVRGIHRGLVNSLHKWPATRKMFPFDDVIMLWHQQDWNVTFVFRAGWQVYRLKNTHHHEEWQRDCGHAPRIWSVCQYPWPFWSILRKQGSTLSFFSRLSEESFPWLIQKFPCILLFKTGQPGPQLNLSEGQIRLDLTSGRPLV